MKVSGLRRQRAQQRAVVIEPVGHHMNHFTFLLHTALHSQQGRAEQNRSLRLRKALPDHEIEIPRFILNGDEGDARSTRWALTRND